METEQEPGQQARHGEHPDVRTMVGEVTGKRVGQPADQSRLPVRDDADQKQEGSEAGQKCMHGDLDLNDAWRNARQKEWPIQGIPGADLRIREERKTRKDVRRPVRNFALTHVIREVFLGRVVRVDGVPLDAGVRVRERNPVKDQDGECQQRCRTPASKVPPSGQRAFSRRGSRWLGPGADALAFRFRHRNYYIKLVAEKCSRGHAVRYHGTFTITIRWSPFSIRSAVRSWARWLCNR